MTAVFKSSFLEDLIDACVMECYFREHMLQRNLLFHDTLAPHLAAYAPEASAAQQRDFLGRRFKKDTERLEKLFELYTQMTARQAAPKKPLVRRG